jgi:hypothetical protein
MMSRTKFAIYAGLAFAIIDIVPMFIMDLPDKGIAILSAFINRFAIGSIIPLLSIKLAGWQKGLIVGTLLSLPDAIITKAYVPILSFGIVGGLIIGILTDRYDKKKSAPAA